jgi:hypothetical protein
LFHRNYIEIVYDAYHRELWWVDRAGITHPGSFSVQIVENSVFAPVTFAKERIIVTICNAKFNSEPSTSIATTVIPESAPDIRGITQANTATPPAVGNQSDALFREMLAVAAAPPTPKTAEDYAQLAASYHKTFQRLMTELNALRCAAGPPCALDTVPSIQTQAGALLAAVPVLPVPPPLPPAPVPAFLSDQALFDALSARTKSLVDKINGLAATLVAGDYLNRATKLAADFTALQAAVPDPAAPPISDLVAAARAAATAVKNANDALTVPPSTVDQKKAADDAVKAVFKAADYMDVDPSGDLNVAATGTALQSAKDNLIKVLSIPHTAQDVTIARNLFDAARRLQKAAKAASAKPPDLGDINARLAAYLGPGATIQSIVANDAPQLLFTQTDGLTTDVATLHTTASDIFSGMNKWRDHSLVTLTSVVNPPGGNAVLNIHIILHEAYAPFAFGTPPKKDATADASKSSSGTITAAAATGTGPEQHEVRRVLVEVHRRADANLVGAIIGSTLPVRAFGVEPGMPITTPSGSGATASSTTVIPYYAYQSQNDHYQIQGMAGINWYLKRRDFYPGYLPMWQRVLPGLLFGTSVTAPGNFIAGLDFEPTNGLDFILGGEVGPVKQLAPGVTLGSTGTNGTYFAAGDTVPTTQRLKAGFVFGIGFDLSVFNAVFSSASTPSSSATPATPAAP